MSEQQKQLSRVTSRIGQAILEFCYPGRQFHADELREFVSKRCSVAPGSADRVLRDLRKRRLVNYKVISRKQSLYRVEPVEMKQSVLGI
jgi:hypothetical protein